MTLEKRYITHGREFKWITKRRPDYCSSSCPLSGAQRLRQLRVLSKAA